MNIDDDSFIEIRVDISELLCVVEAEIVRVEFVIVKAAPVRAV